MTDKRFPYGKKMSEFYFDEGKGSIILKGSIFVAEDFPTLSEVKVGWQYIIADDVTDNDPTKTNTGQSFFNGSQIIWNGTNWTTLGGDALLYDNGDNLEPVNTRGFNIQTGEAYNINNVDIFDTIDDFVTSRSAEPARLPNVSTIIAYPTIILGTENLYSFNLPSIYDNSLIQSSITTHYFYLNEILIGSLVAGIDYSIGVTGNDTITNFCNSLNAKVELNPYINATAMLTPTVTEPTARLRSVTIGSYGNALSIKISSYAQGWRRKQEYFIGGGSNKIKLNGLAKIAIKGGTESVPSYSIYERTFVNEEFTDPYSNSIFPPNPATSEGSSLYFSPSGLSLDVNFINSSPNNTEVNNYAIFAFLTHETKAQITDIKIQSFKSERNISNAIKQFLECTNTVSLELGGFVVSANPGTLTFKIGSGYFISAGGNPTDGNEEWRKYLDETNPTKFLYAYRDPLNPTGYISYVNNSSKLIVNRWDNLTGSNYDGLPNGIVSELDYTNQFLYFNPIIKTYFIVFGKKVYASLDEAIANMYVELFGTSENPVTLSPVISKFKRLGCWTVKGNTIDLDDTSKAIFSPLTDDRLAAILSGSAIASTRTLVNNITGTGILSGLQISWNETSAISSVGKITCNNTNIANGNTVTFIDYNPATPISITLTVGTDFLKGATSNDTAINLANAINSHGTLGSWFNAVASLADVNLSAIIAGFYGNKFGLYTNSSTGFVIPVPALYNGGYTKINITSGRIQFSGIQYNVPAISNLSITYRTVAPATSLQYRLDSGVPILEQTTNVPPSRQDLLNKVYFGVIVHLTLNPLQIFIHTSANVIEGDGLQTLTQVNYLTPQGWQPKGAIAAYQAGTRKLKIYSSAFITPEANRTNRSDPNYLYVPEIPLFTTHVIRVFRNSTWNSTNQASMWTISQQIYLDGLQFNVNNFDDATNLGGGTGINATPNGVISPNNFTIHRVYREYRTSGTFIYIQYGQTLYATQSSAKSSVTTEPYIGCPLLNSNWYYGAIIIKQNSTDFTNPPPNTEQFLYDPTPLGGAGGGGGSATYNPPSQMNQLWFDPSGSSANNGLNSQTPKYSPIDCLNIAISNASESNQYVICSNAAATYNLDGNNFIITSPWIHLNCPGIIFVTAAQFGIVYSSTDQRGNNLIFGEVRQTSSSYPSFLCNTTGSGNPTSSILCNYITADTTSNPAIKLSAGRLFVFASQKIRSPSGNVLVISTDDVANSYLSVKCPFLVGYVNIAQSTRFNCEIGYRLGTVGNVFSSTSSRISTKIGTSEFSGDIGEITYLSKKLTFNASLLQVMPNNETANNFNTVDEFSANRKNNILIPTSINKRKVYLTGGIRNILLSETGTEFIYPDSASTPCTLILPDLGTGNYPDGFWCGVISQKINGKITIQNKAGTAVPQPIKFLSKTIDVHDGSNGLSTEIYGSCIYISASYSSLPMFNVGFITGVWYDDLGISSYKVCITPKYRAPLIFTANTGSVNYSPSIPDTGGMLQLRAGSASYCNIFMDNYYPAGVCHEGQEFAFVAKYVSGNPVDVNIAFDVGNGYYLIVDGIQKSNITSTSATQDRRIILGGFTSKEWYIIGEGSGWVST
jgi:hypothetical protein